MSREIAPIPRRSTNQDPLLPPGMLSSPQIAYCVNKYSIIKGYNPSNLGPATYHMRLGGPIVMWVGGKRVEFELSSEEDKNKNRRTRLDILPNTLVFVTTIEEFHLTDDIIARFNLKSKWVHQGLLLGTGPIVDPELQGRLLIPLHNFSSQSITLNYDDELISVEFTKTLNPNADFHDSDHDYHYIPNKHARLDFLGYLKRIGDKQVESSVSSTFKKFESIIKKQERLQRWFTWGGFAAGVGLIIGVVGLVYSTWTLYNASAQQVGEARGVVEQIRSMNVDAIEMKTEIQHLRRAIDEMQSGGAVSPTENKVQHKDDAGMDGHE